jgi:hypothetical protein
MKSFPYVYYVISDEHLTPFVMKIVAECRTGENGYGESNTILNKTESGDLIIEKYSSHEGRLTDRIYLSNEFVKDLMEFLSKNFQK